MLTGESRFHISTPLGIEPRSLMTGNKRVDHWTSGTVYECSEVAGSAHQRDLRGFETTATRIKRYVLIIYIYDLNI
jgi:hypothetical protein